MELCCVTTALLRSYPSTSLLSPLPPSLRSIRPNPGLRVSRGLVARAMTTEDSSVGEEAVSGGKGVAFKDEVVSGGPNVIEYSEPEKEEEEVASGGDNEALEFLKNFDEKLESGDTYYVIAYGVGALLTLWLSSAVVGALDSVPLLPKLLEVVGLGFTVWFSYRYLLFKKNRDELKVKIEDLKDQILGKSE